MSRSEEQMVQKEKNEGEEQKSSGGGEREKEKEKEKLEGLPLETSPYVKYTDLEDYKRQGYGTEGHLEPKLGQGGGSTDAPTPGAQDPSR